MLIPVTTASVQASQGQRCRGLILTLETNSLSDSWLSDCALDSMGGDGELPCSLAVADIMMEEWRMEVGADSDE